MPRANQDENNETLNSLGNPDIPNLLESEPSYGLNDGFTALPRDYAATDDSVYELDMISVGVETGPMNEADARESGYLTDSDSRTDLNSSPAGVSSIWPTVMAGAAGIALGMLLSKWTRTTRA